VNSKAEVIRKSLEGEIWVREWNIFSPINLIKNEKRFYA
jgi:hypothetical protein